MTRHNKVSPARRWYVRTVVAASILIVAGVAALVFLGPHRLPSSPQANATKPSPPRSPSIWDPAVLSGERALQHARTLTEIGPRPSGSPGARSTALHIAARLKESGLHPLVDEFSDQSPRGETTFRNVIAEIPGTDRTIVLASHFDTRAGIDDRFVGANDSASSTGLLLELAHALQVGRRTSPPSGVPTILLAFLDGEECIEAYGPSDGLHGSRYLAGTMLKNGRIPRVQAFVLIDMVGDRDLTITIPSDSSPHLASLVFDAAASLGVRHRFSLLGSAMVDDHVPFRALGVPVVDIIDFQYGSQPGLNNYWHTTEDSIDKLSAESLATVGRVIISVLDRLCAEQPSAQSPKGQRS